MRVLVACEFSGTVREAFRARGHDAWSCDILPAEDRGHHFTRDVREILGMGWDLMIAHPPCTYLTIAAEWAYGDGPYHQKVKPGTLVGAARRQARAEAYEFFMELWNADIPRVAIENPVGCMSRLWRKPDQIIHPWMFGNDASKATCLWLRGLPLLTPTDELPGGRKARRANQTASGQNNLSPSPDRWKARSITYPGIAAAMAAQWGSDMVCEHGIRSPWACAPCDDAAWQRRLGFPKRKRSLRDRLERAGAPESCRKEDDAA